MKLDRDQLRLAATDITTFASCLHASALDRAVATGRRSRPPLYPDPSAELMRLRGKEHELAYLAALREVHAVEEIATQATEGAALTLEAMKRGVPVIYQGTLRHGSRWFGRPDFLCRVELPSSFGEWSYEPVDAKLARSAKANALLQLCFYSDLLAHVQGVLPKHMALVLGGMSVQPFETVRYVAYFRRLRKRLEEALAFASETYPEPVAHCDVCDYAPQCEARRRSDDHLSLVAGITTSQRRALYIGSVKTVADLAELPLEEGTRVDGIGPAALTRVREQARVQVEGRDVGALLYELLPDRKDGRGLAMLPEPSLGDLFIDFEGDPYAFGDGIEYLFGIVGREGDSREATYTGLWAFDREGERAAFERFMALIVERRTRHPDMHLYHYDHYEPTALKRLAGRHATYVDELDVLLRGGVFVDLYRAVRQGIRASVESYSIKSLEPLFGYERTVPLRDATRCLVAFESWMEMRPTAIPDDPLSDAIEGYNRDDCLSAMHLRDWLEQRREDFERSGAKLARPPLLTGEASAEQTEEQGRVHAVARALLDSVPIDPRRGAPTIARARCSRTCSTGTGGRTSRGTGSTSASASSPTRSSKRTARRSAGLVYEGIVGKEQRSFVHRYRFPPQDHAIRVARAAFEDSADAQVGGHRRRRSTTTPGSSTSSERPSRRRRTRRRSFPAGPSRTPTSARACSASASTSSRHGLAAVEPYAAAVALLRREWPLPSDDGATIDETAVDARARGRRVGPAGPGPARVGQDARRRADDRGPAPRGQARGHHRQQPQGHHATSSTRRARRPRESGVDLRAHPEERRRGRVERRDGARQHATTPRCDRARDDRRGERWSRARRGCGRAPTCSASVDVLFVDEAGQMSLANVLARRAGANEPRPARRSAAARPAAEGRATRRAPRCRRSSTSSASDARSMPGAAGCSSARRGGMHPACAASRRRCSTRAGCSRSRARAPARSTARAARRDRPAVRAGRARTATGTRRPRRSRWSRDSCRRCVDGGATWTDRHGATQPARRSTTSSSSRPTTRRSRAAAEAPADRRSVGTVDKFQGQQAPVVIYSMATSTPEDAPRGMEFLYSLNRLNVAISRARCAAFLVASPSLFELRCKSERQMRLANAFCRYLELAKVVRA